MGRPPSCDKTIGVKKGPWTPEEDIILVSYIQENGPGNWKAVPAKTGLVRCSKSCRLRWTNYLRPGIRRGNFTEREEKLIIHLQALLGNRWAAIASYLPERTDNDIKNYWNTHLRKKLKKLQGDGGGDGLKNKAGYSKGQWERRLQTDINMAKQALCEALSFDQYSTTSSDLTVTDVNSTGFSASDKSPSHGPSATYASSADNISRLLEGWMRSSPTPSGKTAMEQANSNSTQQSSTRLTSPEPHESLLVLDSSSPEDSETSNIIHEEGKPKLEEAEVHFSMLEEWLFDDSNVDMSLLDYTHGMF